MKEARHESQTHRGAPLSSDPLCHVLADITDDTTKGHHLSPRRRIDHGHPHVPPRQDTCSHA